MTLTYEGKRAFITHFASKQNWTNEFDMDSTVRQMNRTNTRTTQIKSTDRKGDKKKSESITLTTDEKGVFARIEYSRQEITAEERMRMAIMGVANIPKDIKSYVEFERTEDGWFISDESGRTIHISQANGSKADHGITAGEPQLFIQTKPDSEIKDIEIAYAGAVIRFQKDGRKSVLMENSGQAFIFDRPTGYKGRRVIFGNLLNTVEFNKDFAKSARIDLSHRFLNAAKLVVALDLGLEPGIKLMNKLDDKKAFELLAYLIERRNAGLATDPKSANYDPSLLQQDWHDTVDFEGYHIDVSRRFGVVKGTEEDHYTFKFGAEDKEFLIAQGRVLTTILKEKTGATPILQKTPSLQTILHALSHNGQDINGSAQDERLWKSIIIETENAGTLARTIRHSVIEQFGPDFARQFVSSVSFEKNKCMIAMRDSALQAASTVLQASLQAIGLIQAGANDADRFEELINLGADLKYVDPEAARQGRSFTDLLKETDNGPLQKVLRDIQGTLSQTLLVPEL